MLALLASYSLSQLLAVLADKEQMTQDTTTLYIRNFPAELSKDLKRQALERNTTLQTLVTLILEDWVRQQANSKTGVSTSSFLRGVKVDNL